jgi:hypothetical protein
METRTCKVEPGGAPNEIGSLKAVLYWGLNQSGPQEANALRRAVGKSSKFIAGFYERASAGWRVPGIEGSFDTPEGVRMFVQRTTTESGRQARLTDFLMRQAASSRDIYCRLVSMCAEVENGCYTPGRVVISAHASSPRIGTTLMSDVNADEVLLTSLRDLTKEFGAFLSTQHLMVSGCATGAPMVITRFLDLFPNLETIWAYAKKSPGPTNGSIDHILEWERQTRRPTVRRLNRRLATGPRAPNVATWSRSRGYDARTRPIEVVRADLSQLASVYNRAFLGDLPAQEQVKLHQFYWVLLELCGHRQLPAGERPALNEKLEKALLLRFYETVQWNFVSHYAALLKGGYAEFGRPMPPLAAMSRNETLQEIFALEQIARPGPAAALAISKLTTELRDLNMPAKWIERRAR